jgi:hypothetical protein
MPRRTKKKKETTGSTYYKAKNGRFYKKVEIDGKTRVRFVSNAEATGAMKLSETKKSKKPRKPRKKKADLQEQPATFQDKATVESDEKN